MNATGKSLLDEFQSFEKGGMFDFGHPLLNRMAESFVKGVRIGAVQAVSREAYFIVTEGKPWQWTIIIDVLGSSQSPGKLIIRIWNEFYWGVGPDGTKRHPRLNDFKGETCAKSLEALVKTAGKEGLQWGVAAGMYSGLTYGLREATGSHDWKNSAVAGAVTGAALALTADGASHEQIVQCAITGAALSTVANLLTGIL